MSISIQRKDYINQISFLPQALEKLIHGLTDQQLDTPYGEGKWTIRQVVHHLADAHCTGIVRFKKILTENNPILPTYEQDEFAELPDMSLPLEPSLDILRGIHERWAVMLEGVDEPGWKRTARHPEDGQYTLDSLLEVYANHGVTHLGHIKQLLDQKHWK